MRTETPLCLASIEHENAFDLVEAVAALNAILQQGLEETCIMEIWNKDGTVVIKLHRQQKNSSRLQ